MATAELGINITARNQARGVLRGLNQDLRSMKAALGDIAKFAAGNVIASGITASMNAITNGSKAAVGAFSSMAMEAADFNAQISTIAAVSGASAAELGQLKQLASDLGVDPGLKVSAVEAAQAIEMLARNGLKVPEILDGAAKSTVLLANATGADFATAADIGTDAMALFGIQANEMIDAVNGITSVTTNSKFSINDYRLALAQGGGVAATVGVEFDDFNTTIAAIAPLFASGSDAGTSFKTFLQRLVPTTGPASDAMRDLGLLTEDGANAFFDASGQMKDMAEISGILNRSLAGLSEEQKILQLSTIFGTDAMRAAAGIAGMTEQEFRQLQETMADTSAVDSSALRMDNLAGDMEIFRGVVESTRIQIGDKFQPAMRELFQTGTTLLSSLQPVILGIAEGIAGGIDAAIGRIQAAKVVFDEFAAQGNVIGGVLAGIGTATGADISVTAAVTEVDWGAFTATYDSDTRVISVDWNSALLGDTTFTYDVDAKILSVDWNSFLGTETIGGFTYDAEAGIIAVNWNEDGFHFIYNSDAQITSVFWGVYSSTYMANAYVVDVLWGLYTHSYNVDGSVTSVLWGAFTNTYDAKAQISETNVLWGAYTHTYDGIVNIGETSILWGAYTHTYDANAQVGEKSVLWGLWTWTYDAEANVTSVTNGMAALFWSLPTTAVVTSVTNSVVDATIDVIGNVTGFVNSAGESLSNLAITVGADVLDFASKLKVTLPPATTVGPLLTVTIPAFEWPALPEWTWPVIEFSWPTLPDWTWPDYDIFVWPSFPIFSWPAIPKPTWNWPSIPRPGWLGILERIWFSGIRVNQPSQQDQQSGAFDDDGTFNYGFNNAIGTRNYRGGLTWVGETGPELVSLPRGSRIFSPQESQQLVAAGSGSIQVTVNVANVSSDMDIETMAYRVAEAIRRRR